MMPGRLPCLPDNPLGTSWHDTNWIPILNTANVMEYFSERSNPFYDRTCNNEIVKMQRLSLDQLNSMTGLEYILLHVQEPILYVIRKQHRHSISHATPLADYYIIAGVVYQAPDLASILNSRLSSTVYHLQSAFEESMSYSRYHPSKGYSWELKVPEKPKKESQKEEPSSIFQRQRVDMLLGELTRKFPLPIIKQPPPEQELPIKQESREVKTEKSNNSENAVTAASVNNNVNNNNNSNVTNSNNANINNNNNSNNTTNSNSNTNSSTPSMKPPPEKKPRLN